MKLQPWLCWSFLPWPREQKHQSEQLLLASLLIPADTVPPCCCFLHHTLLLSEAAFAGRLLSSGQLIMSLLSIFALLKQTR